MSANAAIVWFRQDLRLRNNPALHAAARRGAPVIPVYIWSPEEEGKWAPGSASRWWLHHSLSALDKQLRERGSRLILAHGPALPTLQKLAADTNAGEVFWNRRYEPAAVKCAASVAKGLQRGNVSVTEFNGSLLIDPAHFLNSSGKPYQVYTAFQRAALRELTPQAPLRIPRQLCSPARWPKSQPLESLQLLPEIQWYQTLEAAWTPGEAGAHRNWQRFMREAIPDYSHQRDFPAVTGTSRLSPHLHFGEIDPEQIWHALHARAAHPAFLREILWREFAHYLLHHFPHTPEQPLRSQFKQFPWRTNQRLLHAWQRGRTGIPLVDAGMRELWATGWMHNRVRMVVGSFLVKNLLIGWEEGTRWFWDTLVDADLANNTLNWQWVAGCGADAAPYFRIFNPETQAQRFDPEGIYISKWVREPDPPRPVVDLKKTREAALDAYVDMQRAAKGF
jgi:deoxyribodipyrimidine photo-lyase